MLTNGDFVTLLQLGFGIGIGLSLLRAPLDIRTRRYQEVLTRELSIRRSLGAEHATQQNSKLSDLSLKLNAAIINTNKVATLLSVLSILCAAADLILLVFATVNSHEAVPQILVYVYIIMSSIVYVAIGGCIEALVWIKIGPLGKEIKLTLRQ